MSDSQQNHMSPKPTSGESARFHLSDYRLVARHNFRVARDPGTIPVHDWRLGHPDSSRTIAPGPQRQVSSPAALELFSEVFNEPDVSHGAESVQRNVAAIGRGYGPVHVAVLEQHAGITSKVDIQQTEAVRFNIGR